MESAACSMGRRPDSFYGSRLALAKRQNYVTPTRTPGPYPEELMLQADEHALEVVPEVLRTRSGAIRRLVELATVALAFALFASGLLLVAPGKPPWLFYLATAASLVSLSMALFLIGKGLRELEQK